MMDFVFFAGLILYFIALVLQGIGQIFHREVLKKAAWFFFLAGFGISAIYLIWRGIKAGRLPLSNQFEFSSSFSWGIALVLIFLHYRTRTDWLDLIGILMTWIILIYAALQPREINELMPALRSVWFGIHIGSAAISYACFMLAGAAGLRYLLITRKNAEDDRLEQLDYFMYRLVAIGLLLLTVTIVIGAIWAEEAWSSFWAWDPKEVWALITWIVYAIYLHLRLARKKQGTAMAWYVFISIFIVLFTFIGVNTLLPGLHSYGTVKLAELL
jgi:ABC-type transport system involved in cytochrome c biogenesis permease subunit